MTVRELHCGLPQQWRCLILHDAISKQCISTGEEADTKKDKEKDIIPKDGPKDVSKEPVEAVKEAAVRKSTPEPRFDPEKYEPVVKTPPEPTRVKSPDQVGKWVCFLRNFTLLLSAVLD